MAALAASPAGSLPLPRTRLVGRDAERALARSLLLDDAAPLLTLTGPGGIGKTRLALTIADDAAGSFADGVIWVDLSGLADAGLVPDAVAAALNVTTGPGRAVTDAIIACLRSDQRLLVLDNCEHLLAAAATLVSALVANCPRLHVLATSRAPLRTRDEQVLLVPALDLPPASDPSFEAAATSPAVRLFVQRASAAAARFTLTTANADAAAEICRRLDGLPLAIELAAARANLLSPAAMRTLLDQRVPALGRGARDAPARHQTLDAAIAWSYDLLAPDEQEVFRSLSVFAGGWTLAAAAAVSGRSLPETLEALSVLADQSLVASRVETDDDEPRFTMLETIRAFGLERIETHGDADIVRRRHAAYFATFAETTAAPMVDLVDLDSIPPRLDAEQDNLRAALVWADERGEAELLIRLATALRVHWFVRGRLSEGRHWIDRAAAAARGETVALALQAGAFHASGWYARRQGDNDRAEALGQESLSLFQRLGDDANAAEALELLGRAAEDRGEFHLARTRHERELALLAPLDKPLRVAMAMRNVGWTNYLAGNAAEGERWLDDALAACQQLGYQHGAAAVMSDLATVVMERGDCVQAAALLQLRLRQSWDAWGLRHTVEQLAEVAAACGESERAARLFGAAEAYREQIGATLVQSMQTLYEPYMEAARADLGEAAFAAAWAAGRSLSRDDMLAEAARVAHETNPPPEASSTPAPHGLTRRERDVLRLLVEGRSNREIADALFITYRTATSHVQHILTKLDVSSRTAAATYAIRHGLA